MLQQMVLHIYCRVSSDAQLQGYSLKAQELAGIEKAKQLGFSYRLHIDSGKSAKDEDISNRPALTTILQLIDNGEISNIFVTETDRLTRSPELHVKLKVKFVRHNVIIHTLSGSIDYSNYDQEFMADIKALINKRENSLKSARSIRGMNEAVKKGKWIGVMLPYGYKKDSNRIMIVDEEEAEVYRQMVSMCLNGQGTSAIAQRLNELNIPTRGRKVLLNGTGVQNKYTKTVRRVRNEDFIFRPGTIYCILTNTIHKGERKYKGEIIACPAIIDDITWDRVQEQLKKNRHFTVKPTEHDYLLKGMLRCSRCGANLYGKIKQDERNYMCSSKRYKSCGLRSPNLDRLEALVWDRIINSGQYLSQIQYEWNETGNDTLLEASIKDIATIKAELLALTKREQKLLELYEIERIDLEQFDNRKSEIHQQRENLAKSLKAEEQKNLALHKFKNKTEDLFHNLRGLWNVRKELEKLSFKDKHMLLRQLGTNVIIEWNAEKRTHEIELTFAVNGFKYEKKARLLREVKRADEVEPSTFWTDDEQRFFKRLFKYEVDYYQPSNLGLQVTEQARSRYGVAPETDADK